MKLIILDRDGVINYESAAYIKTPDEWKAIPGSLKAIARLKQLGYKIAIASNQSGVARGLYTLEVLEAIHQKMQDALKSLDANIDKIAFCPHLPDEGCPCRKPKPGLLHEIAEHFECSLEGVPFVGDRLTDMKAAEQVGAQGILVRSSSVEVIKKELKDDVLVFDNLYSLVFKSGLFTDDQDSDLL